MEKELATHSSILAWRIPWMEETDGLHPWGLKESDTTERLTHTHTQKQRIRRSIGKNNEIKSWLFVKFNEIDKSLEKKKDSNY